MNKKTSSSVAIPQEIIQQKIYQVRGSIIMLDRDLALLYQVETRVLNQAVKRNRERFPKDFMFALSKEEIRRISQFVTSLKFSKSVFAFTEQGIAMLSSVLHSKRAIEVNIEIIRVFVKLRRMVLEHRDLARRMEKLEFQVEKQEDQIYSIFDLISKMQTPSKKILGFKSLEN